MVLQTEFIVSLSILSTLGTFSDSITSTNIGIYHIKEKDVRILLIHRESIASIDVDFEFIMSPFGWFTHAFLLSNIIKRGHIQYFSN